MSDSYDLLHRQAGAALRQGDAQGALAFFDKVWAYPGLVTSETRWQESLSLLGEVEAALPDGNLRLAAAAERAVSDLNDANTLYTLGSELIEQGRPAWGATVLARAYRLNPADERILPEWVAALELTRHNGEAVRLLQQATPTAQGQFLHNYLLAFNALMTGDLATPRRLLSLIQRKASNATERHMAGRLAGMLARAAAVEAVSPLDDSDQRGWHFVLTAGILLQPAADAASASWRDASPARLLAGIQQLAAVLTTWQLPPRRVIALDSRDSAILAHATATVLGVPLKAWSGAEEDLRDALIPVYELARVGRAHAALQAHQPHQIVWAHSSTWTEEQPYAADLTTVLQAHSLPFWEARLTANADSFELESRDADARTIAAIAQDIVTATVSAEAIAARDNLMAFARAAATLTGEHGPAALQAGGARLRQWAGSPALR